MKTKGFTLVELLGVVVIITVIFVLVAPAVTNTVSQSRETVYQKQINTILNAAYDFTLEHLNYLPETDNYKFVTIGQLKYEGLIDVNIKNSDTGEAFSDDLVISIKKVGPNQVSNNLSMLRGNYLYTVETDKPTNTNNSPIITLSTEGLKTLTKNSDNNYIMTLNLNEDIPKINVSAKYSNSSEIDLTDQVKYYILCNNFMVNEIKTTTPALYKIKYSVINNDGYATLVVLNVIIADTIPPTITFPETTTISKNITYFDLLKNVSCKDNSGFCDIEYVDTINYQVEGTYTIPYTVRDKSGNTTTKERAITVK